MFSLELIYMHKINKRNTQTLCELCVLMCFGARQEGERERESERLRKMFMVNVKCRIPKCDTIGTISLWLVSAQNNCILHSRGKRYRVPVFCVCCVFSLYVYYITVQTLSFSLLHSPHVVLNKRKSIHGTI